MNVKIGAEAALFPEKEGKVVFSVQCNPPGLWLMAKKK
jgi:hypothetical protein